MSQGAVIIPTTPPLPGATLVGDVNAALAAIISRFSANSAPTLGPGASGALVKGQEWLDTSVSPNQLKVYDGSQFLPWLNLDPTAHSVGATFTAALTATALIPSGSSIPENGIYLPSANTPALAANSTQVWTATSTQFAVKPNTASSSTTTGALVVTGGLGVGGSVYIGSTTAFTQPLTSGWHFDGTINSVVIANGANAAFAVGAGMVILTEDHSYLVVFTISQNGNVTFIANPATVYVNTMTPTAGRIGISWDGVSAYRIYNNFGAALSFRAIMFKVGSST